MAKLYQKIRISFALNLLARNILQKGLMCLVKDGIFYALYFLCRFWPLALRKAAAAARASRKADANCGVGR